MTPLVTESALIEDLPELTEENAVEKAASAHAENGTIAVDRNRSAYHQAGHAVALMMTGITFSSVHARWAGKPWKFTGVGLAMAVGEDAYKLNPFLVEFVSAAGYLAEAEYLHREYKLTREAATMCVAQGDCAIADVNKQASFKMVERGRRTVADEWALIEDVAQLLVHHSLTRQDMVNLYTGNWPQ